MVITRKKGSKKIALSALEHIVGVSLMHLIKQSVFAAWSLSYVASLNIQVWFSICYTVASSIQIIIFNSNVIFFILHISEQGRRNDLKNKKSDVSSLVFPPLHDVPSDSDHCNALTQSKTVSYAFSCHTTDTCSEDFDVDLLTPSPSIHQNGPQPLWVHVFSKSSSTSSLRTQCASGAYLIAKSPKVLHRRSRRAKKKHRKMQDILREVNVPIHQFRLSPEEIDSEIVVFDGGDTNSPPIKPPDGVIWRSIPVKNYCILKTKLTQVLVWHIPWLMEFIHLFECPDQCLYPL